MKLELNDQERRAVSRSLAERKALLIETAGEASVELGQVVDEIDQMAKIAAEPVQLPDDKRVALAQTLQTGIEPWTIVAPPRGKILVEPRGLNARGGKGVALQVENLRAIRLGDAHVANQHVTQTTD